MIQFVISGPVFGHCSYCHQIALVKSFNAFGVQVAYCKDHQNVLPFLRPQLMEDIANESHYVEQH